MFNTRFENKVIPESGHKRYEEATICQNFAIEKTKDQKTTFEQNENEKLNGEDCGEDLPNRKEVEIFC